jgi:hypothetical protein
MKPFRAVAFAVAAISLPLCLVSATDTTHSLDAAADLLTDMMQASDKGVPHSLLNNSQCVILIPCL